MWEWLSLSVLLAGIGVLAAVLTLVEVVLHRYDKTLGSTVVVPYKCALRASHYVISRTRNRWDNLFWSMCRKNRILHWKLQKGRIRIGLMALAHDARAQKEALFRDTIAEIEKSRFGVERETSGIEELNQRRIVVAMEARIGALEDAIAVVEGASVPRDSNTTWRQVKNLGNPTYGKLERVDDEWPFDRIVYFVRNSDHQPGH